MGISSFFPLTDSTFIFHFFQSSSCSIYSSCDETARFPSALVQSSSIKTCLPSVSIPPFSPLFLYSLYLSLSLSSTFFLSSLLFFFLSVPPPCTFSKPITALTTFPTYICTRVFRVFFLDCLTFENGPDRLFRNVGN